jgi:hypothetical protein
MIDLIPMEPMEPPSGSIWSTDEDGNKIITYPNGTNITFIEE